MKSGVTFIRVCFAAVRRDLLKSGRPPSSETQDVIKLISKINAVIRNATRNWVRIRSERSPVRPDLYVPRVPLNPGVLHHKRGESHRQPVLC